MASGITSLNNLSEYGSFLFINCNVISLFFEHEA